MKILLLEDDIALNKSICAALNYSGYDVDTFFDGNEVLNNLNFLYDLYIMDINVPNISGLELLDLIQNQNNQAKIIMISSNTDINTIKNAYNLGCIDYLKKPSYIHNAGEFSTGQYTLPSGQTLSGFQNCELPEHTHREIVDIAVLITSGELQLPDYQIKYNKLNLNQIK